jgi:DUF1365 family protein
MSGVDHIAGQTFHGRRGGIRNAFRYRVDYVLLDPEATVRAPWLFRRNRAGPVGLSDRDHGGPPGRGRGAVWLRGVLREAGLEPATGGQVLLLAQPRVLGHVFNPVSFWLAHDPAGDLRAVVAEVTNTFGDRHCYLCHRPDRRPITASDRLEARKLLHVSPFQSLDGRYRFAFDIRPEHLAIRIDYSSGDGAGGVVATLAGPRRPMTTRGLLAAMLLRPLGARRVLALIHWQALRLWLKGAAYRTRPAPPDTAVSAPPDAAAAGTGMGDR